MNINITTNGNKKLLEAPIGNLEEIAQFQYNLEKLGYVVSKLDANELIIEPKDPKNVFNGKLTEQDMNILYV